MGAILFWACLIVIIIIISSWNEYENRGETISRLINERDELSRTLSSLKSQVKVQLEQILEQANNERLEYVREFSIDKSQLQQKICSLQSENTEITKIVASIKEELTYQHVSNNRLNNILRAYSSELSLIKGQLQDKTAENEQLKLSNEFLRKALNEPPLGFPTLLNALKLYDERRDNELATWLEIKPHPAYTAAQILKHETQKRREAEYESRQAKMLLDYYFSIFPEIQEQNDVASEEVSDIEAAPVSEDEDMTTRYISREEYQNLSITERNQLALDRFWRMHKSKRLIGKLYEQYIGYLYEKNGWIVEYYGISEGFADLGRDLLCHKDITTLIVQCKNWSKSKKIYEKHIFQLFGTKYEYECNNPFEKVRGVFYTSTTLSDLARSFARSFNIELHEKFELQQFPIIKCNIGREGERIYHLPFDQQYYNTKLKAKDGDFYCMTVAEAEAKGFRRAYRWRGSN